MVHFVSADMKTSHGEPATICASSVLDEPELTTKLQLYCLSNAAVMLATALTKLDATKTVRVTGVGVGVGVGDAVATGDAVGVSVGFAVGDAVGFAVGDAVGVGEAVGAGDGVGVALELGENVPLYAK